MRLPLCVQASIAYVLGIDPWQLPDQRAFVQRVPQPDGTLRWEAPGYAQAVNDFLARFGLLYKDVPADELPDYLRGPEHLHLMTGKSVRTAQNGMRHMVVGRGGLLFWDPHPSQAFLTGEDLGYGFLIQR